MRAVNLERLLPSDIPAGERILWHGRPEPISLFRRAYRADFVAGWFAVMSIWNFIAAERDAGLEAGAISVLKTLSAGALALLVLMSLAWLSSRMALYVVTSRRVVLKVGIALPIFFNIPFTRIESAAVRVFADATGDIPLALRSDDRIAYLHLWPHARPFRFARPEPAMRSVRGAAAVAEILSRALIAESNENSAQLAAPASSQTARPEILSDWQGDSAAAAA